MRQSPINLYHGVAGHAVAGAPMTFPAWPSSFQRCFNIYESTWSNNAGGKYNIDVNALEKYLDWMAQPLRYPVADQPDFHSGGGCEATFSGPIVVDMERFRPREYPDAFNYVLGRVRTRWPRADVMIYGQVSKWASQWDTPATAALKMAENDQDNAAVTTKAKHVALYLKDATAAATWERWNEKNAAECRRMADRDDATAYCMVTLTDWDGANLDLTRMLAQVRPAVRQRLNITVWDYWGNNAERDADVPTIAILSQAISQARAEIWGE